MFRLWLPLNLLQGLGFMVPGGFAPPIVPLRLLICTLYSRAAFEVLSESLAQELDPSWKIKVNRIPHLYQPLMN